MIEEVTGVSRPPMTLTREELEQAFDPEVVDMMLGLVPSDDEPLHAATGVRWRPVAETMRDTIRWMVEQGRLAPQHAVALA